MNAGTLTIINIDGTREERSIRHGQIVVVGGRFIGSDGPPKGFRVRVKDGKVVDRTIELEDSEWVRVESLPVYQPPFRPRSR